MEHNKQLIEQFLDYYWLSSGASQNTLSAYRSDLMLYAKWLDKTPLGSANDIHILEYFQSRKISPSTQARILTCFRIFYQYLLSQALIKINPTGKLNHPKQVQKLPVFLSIDEVEKLLDTPNQKTIFGIRDRAMLELLYSCGLRVSELINLEYQQINITDEYIRILGKG
ncbi:MAG: site-specific integrase, partial [Proteobacteria bacterium]|nr:site-specific integrase [Pseudomonadota bacterium]